MLKREKIINPGDDEFCNQTSSTKTGLSQDQSFTIKVAVIRELLKVRIQMSNISATKDFLQM